MDTRDYEARHVKPGLAAELKRVAMRRFHDKRRAAGLCIDCGKPKPPENSSYCAECAAKRKRWSHERYLFDKEIGLCIKCKQAAARPGRTCCFACAVKESARQREYAREKRAGTR